MTTRFKEYVRENFDPHLTDSQIKALFEEAVLAYFCDKATFDQEIDDRTDQLLNDAYGDHGDDCPACAAGTDCCGY